MRKVFLTLFLITASISAVSAQQHTIGLLVGNASSLDAEEQAARNFATNHGFAVANIDPAMILNNPSILNGVQGFWADNASAPTGFNNPTIRQTMRTQLESGKGLLASWYGTYVIQYFGYGTASPGSAWSPVVSDHEYWVDKVDNHPIFEGLSSWIPPSGPPDDANKLMWYVTPGYIPMGNVNISMSVPVTQSRYAHVWASYGWGGQTVNSALCSQYGITCTNQRGVHISSFPEAKVGSGTIMFGWSSMTGVDHWHYGAMGFQMLQNVLTYLCSLGGGQPQSDLVAFWPVDEQSGSSVADQSGNNLNGTANGTTILAGKVGNARALNGTSDYIEVPDNNLLDINDVITIMMWARPNPSDAEGFLINKRLQNDAQCQINYDIKYGLAGNPYLSFQFGSGCTSGSNYAVNDASVINDGNWHHLAVSMRFGDPTSARWVIDGQTRAGTWTHWNGTAGGGSEIPPTNAYPLELGKQLSTSPGFARTDLDQIRIYHRALTEGEIQAVYQEEAGTPVQPPQLVEPADQSTVLTSLSLRWTRVDAASKYLVEFSEQPAVGGTFSKVLHALKVNQPVPEIVPQWHDISSEIPPGVWYWHVAALDNSDAKITEFSTAQWFIYNPPNTIFGRVRDAVTGQELVDVQLDVDVMSDASLTKYSTTSVSHQYPDLQKGWYAVDYREDSRFAQLHNEGQNRRIFIHAYMDAPTDYDATRIVNTTVTTGNQPITLNLTLTPRAMEYSEPYVTSHFTIHYQTGTASVRPYEYEVTTSIQDGNARKKVPVFVYELGKYLELARTLYSQFGHWDLSGVHVNVTDLPANWYGDTRNIDPDHLDWGCDIRIDYNLSDSKLAADGFYYLLRYTAAHELHHVVQYDHYQIPLLDPRPQSLAQEGLSQWAANAVCHEKYSTLYESDFANQVQGANDWISAGCNWKIDCYKHFPLFIRYLTEQYGDVRTLTDPFGATYSVYGVDYVKKVMNQYRNGQKAGSQPFLDELKSALKDTPGVPSWDEVLKAWYSSLYAKDLQGAPQAFKYKEYSYSIMAAQSQKVTAPTEVSMSNLIIDTMGYCAQVVDMTGYIGDDGGTSPSRVVIQASWLPTDETPTNDPQIGYAVFGVQSGRFLDLSAWFRSKRVSIPVKAPSGLSWNITSERLETCCDIPSGTDKLVVIAFAKGAPGCERTIPPVCGILVDVTIQIDPVEAVTACPVDLVIHLADGREIDKSSWSGNGLYAEFADSTGDGHDIVSWIGQGGGMCRADIIPDSSARPTDSFSLFIIVDGDTTPVTINSKVASIPPQGYAFFPGPYASLSGFVKKDTTKGLMGVGLSVFDDNNALWKTITTDDSGYYHIDSIPNGNYTIAINTPLGFRPDEEIKSFEINHVPMQVNFTLTDISTGKVTDIWWWKDQLKAIHDGAYRYKGLTRDQVNQYGTLIYQHFHNRNDIYAMQVPGITYASGPRALTYDDIYNLLFGSYDESFKAKAERAILINLLNVAAGRQGELAIVSADGYTWSQAITYFYDLYTLGGNDNYFKAYDNLKKLYMSQQIAAGVIASGTPNIAYRDNDKPLPTTFALAQNYPNPFNPETRIDYALPEASTVRLEVFNLLGQKVRALLDQPEQAGNHSVVWNGRDDAGRVVSSGVYLYRLTAMDFVETKKMMLLK